MNSIVFADGAAQARSTGWRAFRLRTDGIFAGLHEEEADWAPDDGIASMRDHVRAVATAARSLRARISGDRDRARTSPHDVGFGELVRAISLCHRAIDERLERQVEAPPADRSVGIDEEILRHVQLVAHHAAAASLLSQLIDPARRSPLEFAPEGPGDPVG